MQKVTGITKFVVGLLTLPVIAAAAQLKPITLQQWQEYVATAQQHMQARLHSGTPFLWVDEEAQRAARVKDGNIEVAPLIGHGWKGAPGGLIHHWIGATFIPNASLGDLFNVLDDYDHYKDVYRPFVIDSQLEHRNAGTDQFSMRWLHKVLFVTAALDTDNESHTYRIDGCRAYTISTTTKVREIQNYGQPSQQELGPDEGNGFIWRLSSINRYEERDGGLLMEVEAMALTRDIPLSLRFLMKPVVMDLSRSSLKRSLEQTRDAIHQNQIAMVSTKRSGR